MIVAEIADLKDWQTDRDEVLIGAVVDAAEAAHPTFNFMLRPLKLLNPVNVSLCGECNGPEFDVRDGGSGITEVVCRDCINAVRRKSLSHIQYTMEICWDCRITTDSLGIISGAVHHTFPYNDEPQPDGSIRKGLIPYIVAGRIDLTNDILTLLPGV